MRWYAIEVNPEPWAIGDLSVGRRNGKVYPIIGRNNQLDTFKQAVAEEIGEQPMIEGKVRLCFYFWRNRAEYTTERQRQARAHDADVTNLQKALEDALQGVLFKNDRDVTDVHSVLMAQGPDAPSQILIGIEEAEPLSDLPVEALMKLEELRLSEKGKQLTFTYDESPEDLF